MESSPAVKPGTPISLQDLRSSELFKHGASIRVTGSLQSYSVETARAVIADGASSLVVNTRHLSGITFRVGCLYQFIGELLLCPNADTNLLARVGRNVDGMDLHLYHQSLLVLRQFEVERAGPT
ncbi:unnamed protein product [Spirodela intermedia]|uniref:Uncharacterized protein n=2 Tax=Spirodela intermedia TaxID=51605 RepID=A0A7I8IZV8_SPIIN|nr:unnamed protein product [Spirodela intermedia]CAA6663418.1 unnamed protein product [Spirodela intermedia]CAA7399883.1 unnamed protein product [Spirodela intermedia]